jgi:acetyltransferase-like isoleucine patch superfamily enzyme
MILRTRNNAKRAIFSTNGDAAPQRPPAVRIHPTADISRLAEIGEGTHIWNNSQVREHARIGTNCNIGKDVYIDFSVEIGDNVKIQNGAFIYHGTTIDSDVFIGPGAIFTNDKRPRSTTSDGKLKGTNDWDVGRTWICHGASIGAGAIILPNVRVGRYAMVGAGAVVTHDIPDFALVIGVPAHQTGYVCMCGSTLEGDGFGHYRCPECGEQYELRGENLDRHLETLHW